MRTIGDFQSLDASEPHPGVRLRRFDSVNATVNEYTFDPGASFPLHWHPQEQVTLVLDGEVEMTIDGETSSLVAVGGREEERRTRHHRRAAGQKRRRGRTAP
jgi:oxalate decarboxylase/phosphoglucose isomerase-like protein (cupin superfamily)